MVKKLKPYLIAYRTWWRSPSYSDEERSLADDCRQYTHWYVMKEGSFQRLAELKLQRKNRRGGEK